MQNFKEVEYSTSALKLNNKKKDWEYLRPIVTGLITVARQ